MEKNKRTDYFRVLYAVLISALLIVSAALCFNKASDSYAEEASKIAKYYFGGENGQYEGDIDNSKGIWSYYATPNNESAEDNSSETAIEKKLNMTHFNPANGAEMSYFINFEDTGGFGIFLCGENSGKVTPDWVGKHDPLIGLTMQADGELRIDIKGKKLAPESAGSNLRILKNNDSGFIQTVAITSLIETDTSVTSIGVEKGDIIYLHLSTLNNYYFDGVKIEAQFSLKYSGELDMSLVNDCTCDDNGECSHTAGTCDCPDECLCQVCKSITKKSIGSDYKVYDSVGEFRGIQGERGFNYVYGKVADGITGVVDFPQYNPGFDFYDAPDISPYLIFRRSGSACPSKGTDNLDYWTGFCFTAPSDGAMSVNLEWMLSSVFESEIAGAEGILRVFKGEKEIWSSYFDAYTFGEDEIAQALNFSYLTMTEGERLYVMVDPGITPYFDATTIYGEFKFAAEEKEKASGGTEKGCGCGANITIESAAIIGAVFAVTAVFAVIFLRRSGKKKEN